MAVIHSLPFNLDYSGPANVVNGFSPDRAEDEINGFTVAFRGRKLYGQSRLLPQSLNSKFCIRVFYNYP